MSFKMKNFKIGVNENGFHFQDSETGVIFTLKKSGLERFEMAICSESANQEVCDSLKTAITEYSEGQGEFSDISLEETYIAKNQDLFGLEEVVGDGICILHKQSDKLIWLLEVADGVPVVEFDLSSYYEYETAVKDFFELCSDNIQTIKAGTYHGKTVIQRQDTKNDIKQKLLKCIVEGVEEICLSKISNRLDYTVSERRVIINVDEKTQIKIKKFGNAWVVDQRESACPVMGLVYTIELMKRLHCLSTVTYKYTFEKKEYDVTITQKKINKVLKEAVKRKIINLTV